MSLQILIREKLNILNIKTINLIHVFITGLLLVYIGYKIKKYRKISLLFIRINDNINSVISPISILVF